MLLAFPLLFQSSRKVRQRNDLKFTPAAPGLEENNIMQVRQNHRLGFTLIEIMIVIAIIGLLAAIAIPNLVKARYSAQTKACIENLQQIDGAKERWALENKKSAGSSVDTSGVAAYLKGQVTPLCPASGTYSYNALDTPPECSVAGHTL
jgi:prepilin-type N-terminal cleavage/methylation domain-containing protein